MKYYVYTITFQKFITVHEARQALLLFLEVFYDSTKEMICSISNHEDSELLYFSNGVESPKYALTESKILVNNKKLIQFTTIVNTILKELIIDKVKVSFIKT